MWHTGSLNPRYDQSPGLRWLGGLPHWCVENSLDINPWVISTLTLYFLLLQNKVGSALSRVCEWTSKFVANSICISRKHDTSLLNRRKFIGIHWHGIPSTHLHFPLYTAASAARLLKLHPGAFSQGIVRHGGSATTLGLAFSRFPFFGVTRSLEGQDLHINHCRAAFRQRRSAF